MRPEAGASANPIAWKLGQHSPEAGLVELHGLGQLAHLMDCPTDDASGQAQDVAGVGRCLRYRLGHLRLDVEPRLLRHLLPGAGVVTRGITQVRVDPWRRELGPEGRPQEVAADHRDREVIKRVPPADRQLGVREPINKLGPSTGREVEPQHGVVVQLVEALERLGRGKRALGVTGPDEREHVAADAGERSRMVDGQVPPALADGFAEHLS
ncbi:hypothetical protein ACE2AJ_09745 [Aquihabitans daechungensis]|uniref:hypothetical protein n=1 Tax=Aquihabitans daechungensis TaxID=1052257 RepID=UPI003B9F49EA